MENTPSSCLPVKPRIFLVGGLEHVLFSFNFHNIIYEIILPFDFHVFQDGSKTTNLVELMESYTIHRLGKSRFHMYFITYTLW